MYEENITVGKDKNGMVKIIIIIMKDEQNVMKTYLRL
jgi:hypothetical protein